MKVYIAGPLFNEMERQWNLRIDRLVRKLGVETYLPQRDGGEAVELVKAGGDPDEVSRRLFELDLKELSTCDVLVMVLDGRVPDEGACVELGMAHALGKKCIGFQTDSRSFAMGRINLMIEYSLNGGLAKSWEELKSLISDAIDEIKRYTQHQLVN